MKKSLNIFNSFLFLEAKLFSNRIFRSTRSNDIRTLFLSFLGFLFIASIYHLFHRMLSYFIWNVPLFGSVLVSHLLYMIFLTFFTMLLFSNIIISISTVYLSDDIHLLISTPMPHTAVFIHKFTEALVQSSWMVVLLSIPVLAAYGTVYSVNIMFYIWSLLALIPFLCITSCIGMFFTIILMRFLPAHKTRGIFMLLSVLFLCGIIILLRLLQPERLTNPEAMLQVTNYLTAIKAPTAPYLPSYWTAKIVVASLKNRWNEILPFMSLLFGVNIILFASLVKFANYVFYKGWCQSQESQNIGRKKIKPNSRMDNMFLFLSPKSRALLLKDLKIFTRDPNQWPQLLLLFAITVIYLFNIYYLPLQTLPSNMLATTLRSLTFFLNIGFVGFILSAVAARFIFPAVSMEGKSFWLIKSSPLSVKQFLWEKFWMTFLPMAILAEILILISSIIMKIDPFMVYLSLGTILLLSIGLTSLGVGMGAIYPKFEAINTSEISTSAGGLFYMLWSLAYITAVLVIEAGPVGRHYFMNITFHKSDWIPVIIHGFMLILLTAAMVFVPMILGIRALNKKEL